MAHFNNFGCYLIEVNLDDQSLFRLVLALASGITASLGLLVTFRQHELHSLMHFSTHLQFVVPWILRSYVSSRCSDDLKLYTAIFSTEEVILRI